MNVTVALAPGTVVACQVPPLAPALSCFSQFPSQVNAGSVSSIIIVFGGGAGGGGAGEGAGAGDGFSAGAGAGVDVGAGADAGAGAGVGAGSGFAQVTVNASTTINKISKIMGQARIFLIIDHSPPSASSASTFKQKEYRRSFGAVSRELSQQPNRP